MFYIHNPDNDDALPEKIYIEASSRCNLNCSICFRHGWINEKERDMDFEIYEHLKLQICEMPSVKEVFFGGMGEPLVNPDICRMISILPTGIKKALLTNGTLLDDKMSNGLINAGLSELWISMDGFEREIYESIQLGSRFDLIIRNMNLFNSIRAGTDVRLCVTFVVTSENVEQLKYINEFADNMQVDELNISHAIPGEPIAKEDILYDREDIPTGKMRRYQPGTFTHDDHVCPFINSNSVFIRYDGNVIPCMQLLHSCYTYLYEEKRKITSINYGNVVQKHLLDCWNEPAYKMFRHRVNTFYFPFCTVCWGCDDRKENLCDCILLNETPTCGACLWSTGKVFCP